MNKILTKGNQSESGGPAETREAEEKTCRLTTDGLCQRHSGGGGVFVLERLKYMVLRGTNEPPFEMKLSPMWSIYRQTQSNAVSFFYLKNRVCHSAPSWPVTALHVSFHTTPPPPRCGMSHFVATCHTSKPTPRARRQIARLNAAAAEVKREKTRGRMRVFFAPCWRELRGATGAQQGVCRRTSG